MLVKGIENQIHPRSGVYRIYFTEGGVEKTLYVGQSKFTLRRIVDYLNKPRISTNSPKYDKLDTDFIVGFAIEFLNKKGLQCIWEHYGDDCSEEVAVCKRLTPILQDDSAKIKKEYILKSPGENWKEKDSKEIATKKLNQVFEVRIKSN